MRMYRAVFNGKSVDIQAESSYGAKVQAIKLLRVTKKQESLIAIVLSDTPIDTASL